MNDVFRLTDGLIVDAEVAGARIDCRVVGGRIAELGAGLRRSGNALVVDARGGALLPGLVDHHLHLYATAAARASIDASGLDDVTELVWPPGDGWIRVVGASRTWSKSELDEAFGARPVRVQHRSGALWMLNTAAVDRIAIGLDAQERDSGELWRSDIRLRKLLNEQDAESAVDLSGLGAELLRLGVTQVTDATPDLDEAGLTTLFELPFRNGWAVCPST